MLFMVPTDEHDFGARLVQELGEHAIWAAVARYQQPESHHQLLLAALDLAHGRSQAHLRLTDSDGTPVGPILQYLASRLRWQDGRELLVAGELAYKWFPREEPPGGRPAVRGLGPDGLAAAVCLHAAACGLPGRDTDTERADRPARQAVDAG